jgi:DUF4097 and DUF4098 domain-containing protein YvlB
MTENTRTITAEQVGPLRLTLNLGAGEIVVESKPVDVAEVRLEPFTADDTEALRMIEEARVTHGRGALGVRVPKPRTGVQGHGHTTVFGNGNMVVAGIHISGGGMTMINGQIVSNGAVRIVATVPHGSTLTAQTISGDVRVADVEDVVFTSTSGDLDAVGVRTVNATTVSGDIETDGAERVIVGTTSGDVRAENAQGQIRANSISGDVRVHAVGDCVVTATSVSGDVTTQAVAGAEVSVDAHSVSGRVRSR